MNTGVHRINEVASNYSSLKKKTLPLSLIPAMKMRVITFLSTNFKKKYEQLGNIYFQFVVSKWEIKII